MTTTVHLPKELLEKLDQRAEEQGVSRNRYIVETLEARIREETSWSPRLREMLADAVKDKQGVRAAEEMMRVISSRRTRKAPPEL
ncbi:MAG TPA: YlcI/YnfO family protein [Vicinamibacteria bacterium]|nr:YlcI/YnfO family protein [Vicinamibacteria bacterium]